MEKKRIRVVCALIAKNNRLFVAQRDYGEFKGLYEFPGGKIEKNETPEEAIVREIKEELETVVKVEKFLLNEVYEYPTFILDMDAFLVTPIEGNLTIEKGIHSDEKWISKEEGFSLSWCPADKEIFFKIWNLTQNNLFLFV